MVRIRMKRMGRRNRPFYRINAMHIGKQRDGKILEALGWFNPIETDESKAICLKAERIQAWIAKGAKVSDSVLDMLRKHEIVTEEYWFQERGRFLEANKKRRIAELEAEKKAADEKAAEEAAAKAAEEKAAAEAAAAKAAEEAAAATEEAPAE